MLSFEDNVNRKLDLLWATLMAIVDRDFDNREMISLLTELGEIDGKYREPVEEVHLAETEVLSDPTGN